MFAFSLNFLCFSSILVGVQCNPNELCLRPHISLIIHHYLCNICLRSTQPRSVLHAHIVFQWLNRGKFYGVQSEDLDLEIRMGNLQNIFHFRAPLALALADVLPVCYNAVSRTYANHRLCPSRHRPKVFCCRLFVVVSRDQQSLLFCVRQYIPREKICKIQKHAYCFGN